MDIKYGADFTDGFENTVDKNIKMALLQDGQSIINNEPCCPTCSCQSPVNDLLEIQTSFEE